MVRRKVVWRMFVIVMLFDGIGGSQASSAYVRSLFQFRLRVELVSPSDRLVWGKISSPLGLRRFIRRQFDTASCR